MASESHRPRDWLLVRNGTAVVAWLVKERLKLREFRALHARPRTQRVCAREFGNICHLIHIKGDLLILHGDAVR